MAADRRKRPRLAVARTGEYWTEDNIEWARTAILDNGIMRPRKNGRADLAKHLPHPRVATNALYALNTLQQRETSPFNDSILLYSLETMTTYLPDRVFDQVYVGEQPGEADDFGPLVTPATFTANLERRWPANHAMFRNIKFGPYLFWPINTGDNHYVTAILVLQQDADALAAQAAILTDARRAPTAEERQPVPYTKVWQWSIVDPKRGELDAAGTQRNQRERDRHEARVARVRGRVRAILTRGGIVWDAVETQYMENPAQTFAQPWVPPQLPLPAPAGAGAGAGTVDDDWSSGARCFALIKQQCERVAVAHCIEQPQDDEVFWASSPGWINPHQVRGEMLGLLAVHCIADLRWKARIAIEPMITLDGILGGDPFPAERLKPSQKPNAYFPQPDLDGPDRMRVSQGYQPQ